MPKKKSAAKKLKIIVGKSDGINQLPRLPLADHQNRMLIKSQEFAEQNYSSQLNKGTADAANSDSALQNSLVAVIPPFNSFDVRKSVSTKRKTLYEENQPRNLQNEDSYQLHANIGESSTNHGMRETLNESASVVDSNLAVLANDVTATQNLDLELASVLDEIRSRQEEANVTAVGDEANYKYERLHALDSNNSLLVTAPALARAAASPPPQQLTNIRYLSEKIKIDAIKHYLMSFEGAFVPPNTAVTPNVLQIPVVQQYASAANTTTGIPVALNSGTTVSVTLQQGVSSTPPPTYTNSVIGTKVQNIKRHAATTISSGQQILNLAVMQKMGLPEYGASVSQQSFNATQIKQTAQQRQQLATRSLHNSGAAQLPHNSPFVNQVGGPFSPLSPGTLSQAEQQHLEWQIQQLQQEVLQQEQQLQQLQQQQRRVEKTISGPAHLTPNWTTPTPTQQAGNGNHIGINPILSPQPLSSPSFSLAVSTAFDARAQQTQCSCNVIDTQLTAFYSPLLGQTSDQAQSSLAGSVGPGEHNQLSPFSPLSQQQQFYPCPISPLSTPTAFQQAGLSPQSPSSVSQGSFEHHSSSIAPNSAAWSPLAQQQQISPQCAPELHYNECNFPYRRI